MSAPPRSRNRLRRRYRGTYRRWLVAFENTWTGRGGRSLSLSLNHHILSGLLHRGSSISISTLLNRLLHRGSSISITTPFDLAFVPRVFHLNLHAIEQALAPRL